MRRLAPLLLALALVAPAGSATTTSGLHGIVREPVGVCLQDSPCDGSTAGVTLVFSRGGTVVKRARSREAGRYGVTLRPGTYSVTSPSAATPKGRIYPQRVRVYAGTYRRVDFFVDPGGPPPP
jgi:hypothetical protein